MENNFDSRNKNRFGMDRTITITKQFTIQSLLTFNFNYLHT